MLVNGKNFALVPGGEVSQAALQGSQDDKVAGGKADGDGTLLDCLGCILHLEETSLGAEGGEVVIVEVSQLYKSDGIIRRVGWDTISGWGI